MTECAYGDPTCPCQDGDPCHFEGFEPLRANEVARVEIARLRHENATLRDERDRQVARAADLTMFATIDHERGKLDHVKRVLGEWQDKWVVADTELRTLRERERVLTDLLRECEGWFSGVEWDRDEEDAVELLAGKIHAVLSPSPPPTQGTP